MKSIQQKCQLSDKELNAVLRSKEMSLGEIIGQAIDYNVIHEEIEDIAKAVYDKLRVGFQVMLERAS